MGQVVSERKCDLISYLKRKRKGNLAGKIKKIGRMYSVNSRGL